MGFLIQTVFGITMAVSSIAIPNKYQGVIRSGGFHAYSIPGANVHFAIGETPRLSNSYGGVAPSQTQKGSTYSRVPVVNRAPQVDLIPGSSESSGLDIHSANPITPVVSNNIGDVKIMGENCRYYCRTPEGEIYCCEDSMDPVNRPSDKGGRCPPANTPCEMPSVVIPCSNDARCPDQDKCCFDPCIGRHTCAQPSIL